MMHWSHCVIDVPIIREPAILDSSVKTVSSRFYLDSSFASIFLNSQYAYVYESLSKGVVVTSYLIVCLSVEELKQTYNN